MRSPPGAVAALATLAAQLATAALVPRDAAAPTTAAMPLPFPAQVGIDDSNLATCANANWPPPSSPVGEVISAQLPDADLQAALGEVDPARIRAIVDKLVGFGTRHTLSTQTDPTRGIGAARDWIAEEMRGYAATAGGRMEVTVPGYVQGVASRISFPVRISNVVATLKGDKDPDRVYVVSGHYDSRVTDVMNYEADAPGANDDASGVALAMELARIFATRRPAATIVFTAVAGEEQGLYGSAFMAQTYRNASVNVEGVLNNDIIGSSTGSRGEKDPHTVRVFCQGGSPAGESKDRAETRASIGGENDSPARELGRFIAEVGGNAFTDMKVALVYRLDRYLRGGDHRSFLDAGYGSAVRFTEPNEDFNHQHQDVRNATDGTVLGDLVEFVDFDYVARVAKVNLAAAWSLANAPPQVRNVTVDTSTLSNDSGLSWAKIAGAGAALVKGYEVVWRPTTASLWTHQLYVGDVASFRVPLTKDNVIFGVRSVGLNGYKSPATMPFPG
ncbi:hypothetical protein MCOR02_005102 [Pyricularia oryzae]|uniref:Peptide hydrolase n=1 Tax=Pyricularia oryzae TaxID=318829 RepID=A0A4P7N0W7_PYROR|nr:hypothetical protein MCOR02_005102 [Pyricularia oryzae]KAI6321413.1 hypothetical protein MCOR34_002614 [Pyricularia oryzae]KAI6474580.1 hypothetical protein MCOR17_002017 [Pyricularia oryzae]KAI6505599.1 hypothetical protein MCOR13_004098 [Pyricularia oryzae]KAI6559999.1 hypothetical protein MCOR04_009759 [Pyricularia oryzae]